jgi:hypothetical protein
VCVFERVSAHIGRICLHSRTCDHMDISSVSCSSRAWLCSCVRNQWHMRGCLNMCMCVCVCLFVCLGLRVCVFLRAYFVLHACKSTQEDTHTSVFTRPQPHRILRVRALTRTQLRMCSTRAHANKYMRAHERKCARRTAHTHAQVSNPPYT